MKQRWMPVFTGMTDFHVAVRRGISIVPEKDVGNKRDHYFLLMNSRCMRPSHSAYFFSASSTEYFSSM